MKRTLHIACAFARVVGETVGQLVCAGTIKGDPAAVGTAAGTKIATDCRA